MVSTNREYPGRRTVPSAGLEGSGDELRSAKGPWSAAKSRLQHRRSAVALAAVMSVGLLVCGLSPLWAETEGLVPFVFRVAVTNSSFIDVKENDAVVGFRAFAYRMGAPEGYDVRLIVTITSNLDEIKAGTERDEFDVIFLDSWDYVEVGPFANLPAEFVSRGGGRRGPIDEFLIIVREDSEITTVADLRQKRMKLLHRSGATIGGRRFETVAMENGVADIRTFFREFEICDRASRVVLPVFFRTAAACVVNRSAFETMIELNPQLGSQLRFLKRSAPFLDRMFCVRKNGWAEKPGRAEIMDVIEGMGSDPVGAQILDLFKIDDLLAFDSSDLDSVLDLHERHYGLRQQLESTNESGGITK